MKFCCVIPAYREELRIGAVVRETLRYCPDVVVVDDGSPDKSAEAARGAGAIVVRHEINRGKGAALQTGFQYARDHQYGHVITLDADGQHAPSDIPKFLEVQKQTGAPVIVGSRMSETRKMPLIRKWTNQYMSWLLSRIMKQSVPDTQCGYRMFRVDALPEAATGTAGFAAESEILLQLADRGLRIESAPVQTIYGGEKSKINPVRDTIKFFSMLRRYKKRAEASLEMENIHHLIDWILDIVLRWGYPGIFTLMCLESTMVPVPSELVMPPAGYWASQGQMNIGVAILMGTLGSMAGASINYYLAAWLGRPFFLRYGKYFLCPPHKFEKVEQFALRHGEIGTFTGRLILGVRHFISFPAGLSRMKMSHFLFYTAAGSAIWCTILAVIGYWIGRASEKMNAEELQQLFKTYGKQAAVGAAIFCVVLIAGYVIYHRRKQKI